MRPLPHHPGDAARVVPRQRDAILEEAERGAAAIISRTRIGPGATARIGLAGGAARSSGRIDRNFSVAVIAPDPIDTEFYAEVARAHHAGTLDPRHAARIGSPRRDLALEPADRRGQGAGRIREAPGTAARIAIAARRTNGRISDAHGETRVIAAGTIEADLSAGGRGEREQQHQCSARRAA